MKRSSAYLCALIYVIMAFGCLAGGLYFLWKGSYVVAVAGLGLGVYLMKPNKDT